MATSHASGEAHVRGMELFSEWHEGTKCYTNRSVPLYTSSRSAQGAVTASATERWFSEWVPRPSTSSLPWPWWECSFWTVLWTSWIESWRSGTQQSVLLSASCDVWDSLGMCLFFSTMKYGFRVGFSFFFPPPAGFIQNCALNYYFVSYRWRFFVSTHVSEYLWTDTNFLIFTIVFKHYLQLIP